MELAKQFAADRIDLLLVARSEAKLQATAQDLSARYGISVTVLAKDLSQPQAAEEIFGFCQEKTLSVTHLVNNAGFGDFGLFAESNWEKQWEMIQVNITALTHLTRLFLPAMIKSRFGKVLNVASTAAFQPGPTMSVYYATKAYVLHFSEAIANELQGTGVSVTVLCPGATESGFQTAADMQESKLVKGRQLPSSAEVAAYGYRAMMKGNTVAIHGVKNYLLANSVRFTPRNLVVKIARYLQDK